MIVALDLQIGILKQLMTYKVKHFYYNLCVSLEDLGDLLDLISKCCNLKRSTLSSCQHDCTLLGGCVPQVFDLDQLQHDIAKKYIAGKRCLQSPRAIHTTFYFKNQSPPQTLSEFL